LHIRCISVVYPLFIHCISVVYHVLHHKPNSTPGLAHDFYAGFAAALALLRFFSKLVVKRKMMFVTMYVCMLMYNTYVYIYNYSFVFWYTYIHAYIHAYMHTCIHAYMRERAKTKDRLRWL
jgi:hypothetical protein